MWYIAAVIKQGMFMKIPAKLNSIIGYAIRKRWNANGRSSVLYFHRVLAKPNLYFPDDPTIEELDQLLTILGQSFRFASLKEIAQKRCVPKGEKPMLGISFDDGYQDNFTNALPVLEKHGVSATFFVSTAGTREGILWQDKIIQCVEKADGNPAFLDMMGDSYKGWNNLDIAINIMRSRKRQSVAARERDIARWASEMGMNEFEPLMMSEDELKALVKNGHDIGGHTHNHAILSTETVKSSESEIIDNKLYLERVTGKAVDLFCYPNGHPQYDFDIKVHPEILKKAGYIAAFTTLDGGIGKDDDPMLLPRFLPYRKNPYLRSWSASKIAGEKSGRN
jgi:peptidoglycan/xylan/chitin deacetylase (PgdA/CDA1 family)